ncbi:MAG: hypothetical protein JSR73_02800 [Proteobacteria bacterium]|nr:hypothetical protein [Pseudomonadota bacterium]
MRIADMLQRRVMTFAAIRRARSILLALACIILIPSTSFSQALIVFASGPAGVQPDRTTPTYVSQHTSLIESRPFDGMVINDYLGRNLLNGNLKNVTPGAIDPATGAVSYEVAARGLAPLRGAFKKFTENFVKVNTNMVGLPPTLTDDAGWAIGNQSATNYARAAAAAGLKGIFLDNESYDRPVHAGTSGRIDFWKYEDQALLAKDQGISLSFQTALDLARRRGRELAQSFAQGFPGVVVIVAHGANEGCTSWKTATAHFADDHYLLGAFVAGMIEAVKPPASVVDGGEDYDLKTASDFSQARAWRKGQATRTGSITDLGPRRCPFMDSALAAIWPQKVQIAFGMFDKDRPSPAAPSWSPRSDPAQFHDSLVNAFKASDRYVWLYTQWQDWWGDTTDGALGSWVDAILAARRDAGVDRH